MKLTDKAAIAQVLRDFGAILQIQGENPFKVRAYDVAADRIAGLMRDVGELVEKGELEQLPGIGPAMAKKIAELVTTGHLAAFEALREKYPPGVLDLLKLPELGPKKVMALWQQLQVGDVDSLEQACRDQKVRALKGFGEKTEQKILEGIGRMKEVGASSRRRLGDVLPMAESLLAHVRSQPGVVRAELAGSVRRWCETVSDVDIVASAQNATAVLESLATHPQVAEVLGRGESKCSVRLVHNNLQVDLRVLPDEDYATALHHLSGSKAHHVRLRGLAVERGMRISEWGVHRIGKDGAETKLPVRTEKDLYALLGLAEIPVELREDSGEVEAALSGADFEDLLTLADVTGIVHSHSTWSDGKNSLEEMAVAAGGLGLRFLTVTEHSQAAVYAHGLSIDRLERQWEEIDGINARLGNIRLLKGIEVDILEDGALDYPDRILEQLDIVIGSVHVRHGLDEDGMTRRVLNALDHPMIHVLGHPTGRLIQAREPFPLRMEAVLDRAAERGVAVEVNGNPHRLDLKAEHVRMAVERGVKLVVSADSHSIRDLQNLRFAVATARKGWARRKDVLNTLPTERFVEALRQKNGAALSPTAVS